MKNSHILGFILLSQIVLGCSVQTGFDTPYQPSKFVHKAGSILVDENEKEYIIRGMNFSNNAYASTNFLMATGKDHNEKSYRELRGLGFNSIRYYLNYRMFEYEDTTVESILKNYIDKDVEYAAKYGMKIIFNMHAPNGGYQSSGGGHKLWVGPDSEKNQKDLCELWKKIALHYKNEPAVLGYGIVNEPYLIGDTYEIAINRWTSLANRIIKAIRKNDKNHVIFVERAFQIKKANDENAPDESFSYGKSIDFSSEQGYPKIYDSNYAYEIHFYDPGEFTNQGRGSYTKDFYWPDEENIIAVYNRKPVSTPQLTSQSLSTAENNLNKWQTLQTPFYKISGTGKNVSNWKLICARVGNSSQKGKLFIDSLEIIEKKYETGEENVIYTENFSEGKGGFESSGCEIKNIEYPSISDTGVLLIEGSDSYAQILNNTNLVILNPGFEYSLKITCLLENSIGNNTSIYADFIPCSADFRYYNRDFLASSIKTFSNLSKSWKVPFYVGEYGLYIYCFAKNGTNPVEACQKGGGQYVKDIISVFRENNLNFSYHCYHEPGFALYYDNWTACPSEIPETRINELYDAFEISLKDF